MGPMPFVISVIFIVLGTPLAMRAVAPNRWYGVRTSTTLSDPQTWYSVNATGGKALIAAGIASIIILVLVNYLWTGSPEAKAVIGIVTPLALLAIVCVIALMSD